MGDGRVIAPRGVTSDDGRLDKLHQRCQRRGHVAIASAARWVRQRREGRSSDEIDESLLFIVGNTTAAESYVFAAVKR